MHGEGWHANVNGFDTDFLSSDGANGTATAHVGSHHKCLTRDVVVLAQMSVETSGFTVSGVSLIGVYLDNRSFV